MTSKAPATTSQIQTRQCGKCAKAETSLKVPLKPCAKCNTGSYCSRDCQTADWKLHKKVCASNAAAERTRAEEAAKSAPATTFEEPAQQEAEDEDEDEDEGEDWTDEEDSIPDEMLAALLQKMPHEDTYKIFVNTFQRYKKDREKENGEPLEGPEELKKHFRIFLENMEKDEIVPKWWDESKRVKCEKLAEHFGWNGTVKED
ncbi:hypothetical protein EJ08DRAFT_679011 [Tothia fuscella]|uniref:MYND-type domain-containing protein n=1 Tax=Tothia fuscella TaxID=1048955 RepID=A0A9P4NS62_9PEZI|nr:hypothetical protein EJ08DRAFT_679011 [Tothia fuscella]